MDYNKNVAESIRFNRKALGLTQQELAHLLNGKKSLISNYENGHSCPDLNTLVKLANIFNISMDEFIGRKF